MKILIADKFEEQGLQQLKAITSDIEFDPSLDGETLKAKVAEFKPNVLIVRSTKVPTVVQDASDTLKLIIRAGSGFDTIDFKGAAERGIFVSNCPGMNAVAVAELVMAHMLCLDRKIADNVADLRAGVWNKKLYSKAMGLKGRTIGIIGAGQIGTEVAKRASAFEMNVLYTHLGRNRELIDYPNAQRTEVADLLRRADVVTIHVPGGAGTKALIGEKELKSMKSNAYLINTARATVIDEQALIKALNEGWIAGAAVDVYNNEPAADAKTIDSPLKDIANLYGTHHIGASTEQAQLAVADEVVRIVKNFGETGEALHCVNMGGADGPCMLIMRFAKPGALAFVFDQLKSAEANIEEMDHVGAKDGDVGSAQIRLNKPLAGEVLEAIRGNNDLILSADVIPA